MSISPLSEEQIKAGEKVEALVKRRSIRLKDDFPQTSAKEEGISAGYLSHNEAENTTNIIKVSA